MVCTLLRTSFRAFPLVVLATYRVHRGEPRRSREDAIDAAHATRDAADQCPPVRGSCCGYLSRRVHRRAHDRVTVPADRPIRLMAAHV
jgi:hypothetical protein